MDVTPSCFSCFQRYINYYVQSVSKLCGIKDQQASGCQYGSKMSNEHRSRNASVIGCRGQKDQGYNVLASLEYEVLE
jgi:hypothetical protein